MVEKLLTKIFRENDLNAMLLLKVEEKLIKSSL